MADLQEAVEQQADNSDEDEEEQLPPISNREMELACGRLEDRLEVLQTFSQIPNKLANTYCIVCRRFLRMKAHNCTGVADHDFMKKFGGVFLLSQEFITLCLNQVRVIRTYYQDAVDHDIHWQIDQPPAELVEDTGIEKLWDELDQSDIPDPFPEPVKMPLNGTVYDSWASRLDFVKYEEPYPFREDGVMWVCFLCFRLHEDKHEGCPMERPRSIQNRADEQVHLKLDERISGHKISTEEVWKAFYEYTVEQLEFYRRLRRQDFLLNEEKYSSRHVDDTDDDLFLPPDEDEKVWLAEQRKKKLTKKVRKSSPTPSTSSDPKKPRKDEDPNLAQ